jgi:hypothetical protein
MGKNVPKYRYATHKCSAKQRGIPFEMSFEEGK